MVNNFRKNRNEILKEECLNYLGGKICQVLNCGNNYLPISCYDFHHYKGNKEIEISKLIQKKKKLDVELRKELDKCKVVCSNCHRMITMKQIDIKVLWS